LKSSQQKDGSLHSVTLAQIWDRDDLFRTPSVTDSTGGAISEKQAVERGRMVKIADQVTQLAFENGLPVSPSISAALLPTTTASDWKGKNLSGGKSSSANGLPTAIDLLMTPMAQEGIKAPSQQTSETKSKTGQVWLSNQAKDMEHSWGRFEPAIKRWEHVLGRPAPAPTKPDGRDGSHRLSSEFTEWMMGLESGWVTGCGLTRNEELKACGNGVVPQQAKYALDILLEGMTI
jgi:DNA (cytosine-5)-methyltransferase 1